MAERRIRRQTAIRMFAREYFEASLVEQGSGEFDPSFVITKLGAKVNRMIVAGLLERMERRETDNGTMYFGSIRDPTGLHMFSIGSFQPELHVDAEELLALHERNEPILLLAVGKSNSSVADDGGIFTRIRLEEFTTIQGEGFANWLVDAAGATLRRIEAWQRARDIEPSADTFRAVGIPEDLIDGLIKSRGHYGEVETDTYMVGVMRALDRVDGNISSFVEESQSAPDTPASEPASEEARASMEAYLKQQDQGDGVPFEQILSHFETEGISRSDTENLLFALVDDGAAYESPSFWFRHTDS